MTYYKAYTAGNTLESTRKVIEGTDRKQVFQKAQEIADRTGTEVGIQAERGTWLRFYRIVPRG